MNWLIERCKESATFTWILIAAGVAVMILIWIIGKEVPMEKQKHTALAMVREALQAEANQVSFEKAKQLAAERYEAAKEEDNP